MTSTWLIACTHCNCTEWASEWESEWASELSQTKRRHSERHWNGAGAEEWESVEIAFKPNTLNKGRQQSSFKAALWAQQFSGGSLKIKVNVLSACGSSWFIPTHIHTLWPFFFSCSLEIGFLQRQNSPAQSVIMQSKLIVVFQCPISYLNAVNWRCCMGGFASNPFRNTILLDKFKKQAVRAVLNWFKAQNCLHDALSSSDDIWFLDSGCYKVWLVNIV